MRHKSRVKSGLLAAAGRAVALLAFVAATPSIAQNSVSLDGAATTGVANVNAASGNNNQQLNVGLIAESDAALARGSAIQHLATSAGTSGADSTSIAAGAFAGASGWVAVNGASGNDNQQANMAAFAIGIEAGAAADALLSQSRASTQPAGRPTGPATQADRSVAIGAGAFGDSSGLLQVSLIGGDRNSSANTFALSVSGGATP